MTQVKDLLFVVRARLFYYDLEAVCFYLVYTEKTPHLKTALPSVIMLFGKG